MPLRTHKKISRRNILKIGASAASVAFTGATPFTFVRGAWAETKFRNNPGDAASIKLGLNLPQTGPYADEGADELLAYKLAIKHLNGEGDGGLINTLTPSNLKGKGILGKKVEYIIGDSQTKADIAVEAAKRSIAEGAIMITGGSSSAEAIAVQKLCQDMGIIFMAALTHSNDTTGKDRRRYGFRHFFNAYMSGQALAPVLKQEYGADRRAYHLTADYTWGWTQEESIKNATEKLGWQTVETVRTPLGASDYSSYLATLLTSGADVLILNHYGKDMVNSLSQAVQFGLRDQQVNGKNFQIVVPLISDLMAQGAGENIKGILGTGNWHYSLPDKATQAIVKSFTAEYGQPPSQAGHTSYVQTLLYANAVETAGTFYPPEVIKALEGFKFDGMGNGPTLYRAEDHQCFKNVLVVRGRANPTSKHDLLEVVQEVPTEQVMYDPNIPQFKGDLGPYTA